MQQPRTPMGLDKRVLDTLAEWRDGTAWDSGFLGLVGCFVPWFDAERIEYAFTDSLAIRLHRGCWAGISAFLVVTPTAWQRILQTQGTTFGAATYGSGILDREWKEACPARRVHGFA